MLKYNLGFPPPLFSFLSPYSHGIHHQLFWLLFFKSLNALDRDRQLKCRQGQGSHVNVGNSRVVTVQMENSHTIERRLLLLALACCYYDGLWALFFFSFLPDLTIFQEKLAV